MIRASRHTLLVAIGLASAACAPGVSPPPLLADLEQSGRWKVATGSGSQRLHHGASDGGASRSPADLNRDIGFCNHTAAGEGTPTDLDPRYGTTFLTCMQTSGWNYQDWAFR
jgi:hypothetical protein